MKKLFVKTALFALVVPGTVSVALPLLIVRGRPVASGVTFGLALLLLGLGAAIFLRCAWDFVVAGKGTPAPIDRTERLVIRGLYRYSRNPMYVGVLSTIAGWAALFGAGILAAYGAAWFIAFSLFVRFHEEPYLTREFGDEYLAYRKRVGRWLPKRSRGNVLLLSFLAGFALGCGTAGAPDPGPGSAPEWTLRRAVTIGAVDHPTHALSSGGPVLTDADRVYILQPQEGRVRVFSRDGDFVRYLGGAGAGPGEILNPSGMGWHGPRLWVADWGATRFTLFDVSTGEAETIPYRPDVAATAHITGMSPRAMLADGNLVGSPSILARATARGIITERPQIISDTAGVVRDTLAALAFPTRHAEITAGLGNDGTVFLMHPLRDADMIAFAPDGTGAVLVGRGAWEGSGPAAFEVARIDVRGDTIFHRLVGYEPRPVPDGFFDAEIDEAVGYGMDYVDRRAFARAVREFYEQREYFPPVTNLTMGSDYTTWLAGRVEDGERTWLVLDASGESIGRLRLPSTSYVAAANATECWVVERDALDISYVVRYDIER